jgi:hypothetical protein
MTHEGQSAARVSGSCFVMGEAAGVLAAMSVKRGAALRELPAAQLQAVLRENGVFLG